MTQFSYNEDLEKDLQSYEADGEKVDTAIQGLESMTDMQNLVLESNEGIDTTTFKVIQNSMESFMKLSRIGAPAIKPIQSLESFTKYDLSQASLEGLGEGIKNVFMSIINAIKKAFQWVWGLIKRIFGRNTERDEKIAEMKTQADEIKEKAKSLTPEEQKDAPAPRTSDGWFKEVKLSNSSILKRLVTSHGLMDKTYLDKLTTEMIKVFEFQGNHNRNAFHVSNGATPETLDYKPPFAQTTAPEIVKAVGVNRDSKIYASLEFGGGTHVVIAVPPMDVNNGKDARANSKERSKWADGLLITKVETGKAQSPEKFSLLQGDLADGDLVIETVQFLNKMMRSYSDKLETFQKGKEMFLKDFEAQIKKLGANLFSSSELKTQRDEMLFRLKYFKKTMDQPALFYFGLCDGIVSAYEHMATYILAYNRTNGNHVELKKE